MRPLFPPLALLISACARSTSESPQDGTRSIPIHSAAAPTASAAPPVPTAAASVSAAVAPTPSADDTSFLPPAPPVDLAASLRDAVTAAAAALHTGSIPYVTVDAFVLVNADRGPLFAGTVDHTRKALDAFFHGRFTRHPDRAVTVFVFSSSDAYDRFCAGRNHGHCPTKYGEYDRVSRTIVLHTTEAGGSSNHELVHPCVQQDFPRAPAWLDEGIAALYEHAVSCQPGELTGISNWRYPDVKRAIDVPDEQPDRPRLEALFRMDTVAFLTLDPAHPEAGPTDPAKENRHYGLARYFAQWMDRQHRLWPFYRAWRDGIATDRTGETAFAAVMGRTPGDAEADWEAYVRSLAPPAKEDPCRP